MKYLGKIKKIYTHKQRNYLTKIQYLLSNPLRAATSFAEGTFFDFDPVFCNRLELS